MLSGSTESLVSLNSLLSELGAVEFDGSTQLNILIATHLYQILAGSTLKDIKMKIGDMVKHKWGTLAGHGLVIEWLTSYEPRAHILWNCHGNVTVQNAATKFLEVISEV
jgi:hypothetical protein